MRKWIIVLLAWSLVFSITLVVLAQTSSFAPSPYIYKLIVGGCRYEPVNRTLTAFRVKDQIGLVTALHGVAGCELINAQPVSGNPLNRLMIGKVDIDRDVALLWSKDLAMLPPDGLDVVTAPQASDYAQVSVIGYPYGLFRQKPTLEVKIVETTELGNLLPPDLILVLDDRSSPAIDVQVLSVQTHLVPGHSGAPLLNSAGKVIGIGNGGLDLGRVEMGWAIPWHTINWKTVSQQVAQDISWTDFRRLQTLANSQPHLFSFAAPEEGDPFTSPLTVTLTITATITPIPTATPTPTPVPAYPCNAAIISPTGAQSVNTLRAKPSLTSSARGALAVGSTVIITQKAEDTFVWYRVTRPDGRSLGWIPAENVSLSSTCPE